MEAADKLSSRIPAHSSPIGPRVITSLRRKMARPRNDAKNLWTELLFLGVSLLGSGLLLKWAIAQLDPNKAKSTTAKLQKAMLRRRLGKKIDTDNHEDVIACDAVNPESIDVTLNDVGGLEETKTALNTKVIMPLKRPELFNGFLLRQAKGVLLYGPPGTGKTMLAKALAKEAGASFINIRASTLQSKWFGETQKLVQAVFTLAYKLQPCIVFIDEVDSLLGRRREQEHDAITTMKTEFMQLWDGFTTDPTANVMVLAATNRPYDLDEAVLRRFPVQLEVGMPDAVQREAILKLILRKHMAENSGTYGGLGIDPELAQNVASVDGRRPLLEIAEQTPGFSGSDLLELCSRTAAVPIQEYLRYQERSDSSGSTSSHDAQDQQGLRRIKLKDFLQVLQTFKPSTHQAEAYRSRMAAHNSHNGTPDMTEKNLLATLALMSRLAGQNGD